MKDKKTKNIKVSVDNPEASMKLTVKGKDAINQGIKIMQAFDETCKEIREKEKESERKRRHLKT